MARHEMITMIAANCYINLVTKSVHPLLKYYYEK
jgi:hypothetical protein